MNNLDVSVALATAPSSAFAELRERPRSWFPLLLAILATAATVYWYYSVVDIDWLKDTLYASSPQFQQMDEEKRAAAMAALSRTTLQWSSLVGTLIMLPLVFVIWALYLLLAGKVARLSLGFKHWFALVTWCSLPMLLNTVVSGILLLLADNPQIGPGVLQPLSLNELLLHRPFGSPGQGLLESLSIPAFLTWALMIIGIRTWSQRSWALSAYITLLPWVLIYGLWAFFAFR
jgi:hypothetical protein